MRGAPWWPRFCFRCDMQTFVVWGRKYEGWYIEVFESKEKALEWVNAKTKVKNPEYFWVDYAIEGRKIELSPVERVTEYEFK